jgi:hypothetical protein
MAQVDRIAGLTGTLGVKAPVRVATTSSITLSGLQTVDGVALAEGDRVLVKNQTDTTQNGIYDASTVAWTRSPDFDGSRDILQATTVLVAQGSANAHTAWQIATADPVVGSAMSFTPAGMSDASTVAYTPAGAGAVATTVQAKLREGRSVKDFGAVGDGVANDTAEIQAAVDALADGESLYFPKGTYLITTTITINKPITLHGDGQGTILKFTGCNGLTITHDGAALDANVVRNMSLVTTNNGVYTGILFTGTTTAAYKVPRIILEHLNLSGSSVAGASTEEWLTAISLTEADAAQLLDVSIKGKETAYSSGYVPATKGIAISNGTTIGANCIQIWRVKTGVEITGQSEGFNMQASSIVAVHTGVACISLTAPSNNHQFNNTHISASQTGVKIDQTGAAVKTLGHTFSNMFIIKRLGDSGMGPGGDPNYKAIDASIDRSVFSNISLHTNDATTDRYAAGDRGIYLRDGAMNNMIVNIIGFLCGTCVSCVDTSRDNMLNHVMLVNGSGFTYYPIESVIADGQITSAVIDTAGGVPSPSTGSEWRQVASQYAFWTAGGRAFKVTNGAAVTDSFVDVFGQALADACCTVRANSESGAANVDLQLLNKGAGKVRFGVHTGSADAPVSGYIEIKDAGGTVRKLAVIT